MTFDADSAYSELQLHFQERVRRQEPLARHCALGVGGPADLWVVLEARKELIGLVSLCAEEHWPLLIVGNGTNILYADAGVRCHELLAFIVSDDESATIASAEQLADQARTIGAEWVLTVFTDKVPTTRIQHCARLFDDAGAGIAVEYTPLGAIPTISDGMEYVRAACKSARAGLIIDSWHFCFSSNTWEDLAAVPLDDIAYLQFTDVCEWTPDYTSEERNLAIPSIMKHGSMVGLSVEYLVAQADVAAQAA